MHHFMPFPFLIVHLLIIIAVIYLINKWVNKFISLKHEQNEILREILKKFENK
jgi:hypothetical protein